MQAYEIFILELQAARKRLRKTFELPDGCRSDLEHNGVVQSCEERPISLPRPWKRSSRINTKRVYAATAVIGIAAICTLFYAGNKGNENKQRATKLSRQLRYERMIRQSFLMQSLQTKLPVPT